MPFNVDRSQKALDAYYNSPTKNKALVLVKNKKGDEYLECVSRVGKLQAKLPFTKSKSLSGTKLEEFCISHGLAHDKVGNSSKIQALCKACINGKKDEIESLFKSHKNFLKSSGENNLILLALAAKSNNKEALKALLNLESFRQDEIRSAFEEAVDNGSADTAILLFDKISNPSLRDELHLAIASGNRQKIAELVKKHPISGQKPLYRNALLFACRTKKTEAIKELVQQDPSLRVFPITKGETVFKKAWNQGDIDVVKALLDNDTPISLKSACIGYPEVQSAMNLDRGALFDILREHISSEDEQMIPAKRSA